MRILAVDYGQKNIGLALSDETGVLARPWRVLAHVSRPVNAALVAQLAQEQGVSQILVGVSYDEEGNPNHAGRVALNFMEELKTQTGLPVQAWDESLTTQDARAARLASGASRKRRAGHLDDVAAAILLQGYLDSRGQA